jgi:ribosomal protein S18 acetylase RimI-like enzyme
MAQAIDPNQTTSIIRRVRPEDARGLRTLYERLLATSFEKLPAAARLSYLSDWTTDLIATRAVDQNRVMLGLFNRSRLGGYVLGTVPEGGVGTIIWLAVEPALQGRKFGRQLMVSAFGAYKELGCHKVKLFAKTREALSFYEHIGMTREGFHPHHWWNVDYWSLARDL